MVKYKYLKAGHYTKKGYAVSMFAYPSKYSAVTAKKILRKDAKEQGQKIAFVKTISHAEASRLHERTPHKRTRRSGTSWYKNLGMGGL